MSNWAPSLARLSQRWLVGAAVALLALSLLRGLRFPNLWAYSHFLFNYEFGFGKRGLLGEVVRQIGQPALLSYEFFWAVSLALLALNTLLLARGLVDLIRSRHPLWIGAALVYASSLAVVYLAHTVGYFDQIGLLLALITARLTGFYRRLGFVAVTLPPAVLIHEAIFLQVYPLLTLLLLLSIDNPGRERKLLWVAAFSAALAAGVWLLANHTLDAAAVQAMQARLQAQVTLPLRPTAFAVLGRDGAQNLAVMAGLWATAGRWIVLALSLLVTAPSLAVLLGLAVAQARAAGARGWLLTATVVAGLAPLLLHAVGADLHRWNTLAVTTSFVAAYGVYRAGGQRSPLPLPRGWLYAALAVVIFLNGTSTIPLFDGDTVQQFPFYAHQRYLQDVLTGAAAWPHAPSR